MSATGALIVLAGVLLLGTSIWGLFNRKRSIFCALAGALVALYASLGAWYAWAEIHSALGTAIYLAIELVGIASVVRQIKPRKS